MNVKKKKERNWIQWCDGNEKFRNLQMFIILEIRMKLNKPLLE